MNVKMKTSLAICAFATLWVSTPAMAQTKENNKKCASQNINKTRSKTFVMESETPWEPAGEGVTRQIMGYDGQSMLVKVKFEKGAIGTPHAHYHTQNTYVVSGVFEFTVGDEKKVVKAGDGLYIEPDVVHGCVALEPGVLIDCFTPMRADFIGKK